MSTIDLSKIDENIWKQIVQKFNSITTGSKFYRSCRGARDFVDLVKPAWPHGDLHLAYRADRRYGTPWFHFGNYPLSSNLFEFCRVGSVFVDNCTSEFFDTEVLPEVASMRAVTELFARRMSVDQLQLLMAAAKPLTVDLKWNFAEVTSPSFNNVRNIVYRTVPGPTQSEFLRLCESNRLFQLVGCKKTIEIWITVSPNTICIFLEHWLNGEPTGSLKEISFCSLAYDDVQLSYMVNRARIQRLMRSCAHIENGYILERQGLDRLRISDKGGFITVFF